LRKALFAMEINPLAAFQSGLPKGVTVNRNKNGVLAISVHYSADPAKDPDTPEGQAWLRHAKEGMTPSMWNKEMEMDFQALRGKLVYEEWNPEIHVVNPCSIPFDWTIIHAVDPGLVNPCAMLWAAVKPDGDIVFFDEYYVAEKTIKEHASAVRQKEGQMRVNWRIIDSAAYIREQVAFSHGTGPQTIAEQWESEGFYFHKGSRNEELGITKVHEYLKFMPELGKTVHNPRLTVFSNLVWFRWEIEKWKYPEQSPVMEEKKNPVEKGEDKDNHLMDCMRLILQENPTFLGATSIRPIRINR
jgi:hypothetical protein